MGKLRVLSGQDVCALLERHGFTRVRQRGSHVVMQRVTAEGTTTVPVPDHKELRVGTLRSIIPSPGCRGANLRREAAARGVAADGEGRWAVSARAKKFALALCGARAGIDAGVAVVRNRRRAVTLLEVILVLAVIIVASALAYPSVNTMYAQYRVRAASDTVKAAWVNARTHAIEEGRRYRFSVVPGKGNYRIAPDAPEFWSGGNPPVDDNNPALILEDRLPKGIRFSLNGNTGDPGNANDDSALDNVNPGQWVTAAAFESDGTAQDDVEVVFQMTGSRPLSLHLRALTGIATVRNTKENR